MNPDFAVGCFLVCALLGSLSGIFGLTKGNERLVHTGYSLIAFGFFLALFAISGGGK